jgi:hypothetical protein
MIDNPEVDIGPGFPISRPPLLPAIVDLGSQLAVI